MALMETKSSAHYQRKYRERLREQGLIKKEVWILPEHSKTLMGLEKQLRQPAVSTQLVKQEGGMSAAPIWTTDRLYEALASIDLFRNGGADIELVQGADPSMHLVMREFGDLPVFVSVIGEQIIVESVLWPVAAVRDEGDFNRQVLCTQKLFPLSTIGIERTLDGEQCYIMFGALSAESSLSNVVLEIETLADNVIKATEAYEELLGTA